MFGIDNKIGDEGLKKISESLMNNSSLTALNLACYCFLNDMEISRIIDRAKQTDNSVGVEGATSLKDLLMVNTSLVELNLDCFFFFFLQWLLK